MELFKMHDDGRSQNLYVCSILALGNENQTVSDSGQAENLKEKKKENEKGWRTGEYAVYKTQQGRQGWSMAPSVVAVIKPWFAGHGVRAV
jgi:hypothetical protein